MAARRSGMLRSGSVLACLLTLGLALGAGCASEEEQMAELLREADASQEAGEDREALISLRKALKLDPQSADLNFRIAQVLRAMGRREAAAFHFGETYRLDPDRTDAAVATLPFLIGSNREAAAALVAEILEREPDNAGAYAARAELALLSADTGEALKAALIAVELAPDEAFPHRTVGTAYRAKAVQEKRESGQLDEASLEAAVAAYDRAGRLPGGSWADFRRKALVYANWPGHAKQSNTAWQEAFEASLENGTGQAQWQILSEALTLAAARGDREAMRWALERQTELAPANTMAWERLALLDEETGGSADAMWDRALEAAPKSLGVNASYARHLAATGRNDEALAWVAGMPDELADTPFATSLRLDLNLQADRLEAARENLRTLQAEHPDDPYTVMAQARMQLLDGRAAEAAAALRTLATSLERADVFLLLAQAERRAGNTRAALAAIQRAIELDPTPRADLLRTKAELQGANGDWEGLLRTERQMRQRRMPPTTRDAFLQARAYYETGRPVDARWELRALLGVANVQAVLMVARHEGASDPEYARRVLENAQSMKPESLDLASAKAWLEFLSGRPDQALAVLDAAPDGVESLPPRMRLQRARVLARLERLEEAEQDASAAFAATPRPAGSAGVLAEILEGQGRRQEAIARLEESQRQAGLDANELWRLGRLYLSEGEMTKSRKALEASLDARPGFAFAENDLAYVLVESGGDLERALALASAARATRPEDPYVADTLGWVYYKRGLLEPAAAEFRSAIELAGVRGRPGADFHYHYGLALLDLGRQEEARRELDRALEIQPGHEKAKDARAGLAGPGTGSS